MSRHQLILRVSAIELPNIPIDTQLVTVVTNPYNASVDFILEHPSFPAVPEFEAPNVITTHTPAAPEDWAMTNQQISDAFNGE